MLGERDLAVLSVVLEGIQRWRQLAHGYQRHVAVRTDRGLPAREQLPTKGAGPQCCHHARIAEAHPCIRQACGAEGSPAAAGRMTQCVKVDLLSPMLRSVGP